MATRVKLPALVHNDKSVNEALPRVRASDLGRCFNLRDFELSSGWACQHIETSKLIVEEQDVQLSHKAFLTKSVGSVFDSFEASGTVFMDLLIVQARGTGVFETITDRKSCTFTICQYATKQIKSKAIDTNALASGDAFADGRHLVEALRMDPPTVLDYMSRMGTHYISHVALGAKVFRTITVTINNVHNRKKFQAEVEASIGIGPFRVGINFSFASHLESIKDRFSINIKTEVIGGDRTKLQQTTSEKNADNVFEDAEKCLKDFLENVTEENMEVIHAEAEPITRSIVKSFCISEAEEHIFYRRVGAARERIDEMVRWELELRLAKKHFEDHATSIGLQPGRIRSLVERFQATLDTFVMSQIRPLRKTLTDYLRRDIVSIISGDAQFADEPPQGTSNSPAIVDDRLPPDVTLDTLGVTKLSGGQMNSLHDDLLKGRELPIDLEGGHVALWDGPVAFDQPLGLPNEVRFFHRDVNRDNLRGGCARSWKFRVKGEDWDPENRRPVLDDATFVEATSQYLGNAIDFEKVPDFFKEVRYEGFKALNDSVTYRGEWIGQFRDGVGVLRYTSSDKECLEAEFTRDKASTGCIKFRDGGQCREYVGNINLDLQTLTATMHGRGTLTFKDDTITGELVFRHDRVFILSQQKYLQLDPRLREDDEKVFLWLENDLLEAQSDGHNGHPGLGEAITAAEAWLTKHKHRRLERVLHEAKQLATPLKCLLLGPPEAGKTALVNLMCNFGTLSNQQVDIDSRLNALQDYHVKAAESSAGKPSTAGCHRYSINVGERRIVIIDSPGVDSSDETTDQITSFCRKEQYLNCICFVVSGRVPERMAPLPCDLAKLGDTLGRKLLDNVFVLLTGCRGWEDGCFEVDSLTGILGRTVPPQHIFCLDDPYVKLKVARAKGREAAVRKKLGGEDYISDLVQELSGMFKVMQSFSRISFPEV